MAHFIDEFKDRTIRIPLLQRDYVQGGNTELIRRFLKALLDDKKPCDLNYIYGYEEQGEFIPVDGQQRLITLWLLHLYVYKLYGLEYTVKLKFASREYAQDFSAMLVEKLAEVLKNKTSKATELDKLIENETWFFKSWKSSETVKSMLGTLRELHKLALPLKRTLWKSFAEGRRISFSFLYMPAERGVDDDVYIKMNGRGRKLTDFENLKSSMDELLTGENIYKSWARNMDNSWAQWFWTNREYTSEGRVEDIDEARMCLVNNLLILWNAKNGRQNDSAINKNFLFELYDALNILCDNSAEIEGALSALYLSESVENQNSRVFNLCMRAGDYKLTLPLLFAVLTFYSRGLKNINEWLRVMRNLILNSDINEGNFPAVLNSISALALNASNNIFEALLTTDIQGLSDSQVAEERLKSEARFGGWRADFSQLENNSFFAGRIAFVFEFLKDSADFEPLTLDNFRRYALALNALFPRDLNTIWPEIDSEDEYLLRRALMCFEPHRFGFNTNSSLPDDDCIWNFCATRSDWQKYLLQDGLKTKKGQWGSAYYRGAFRLYLKNIATPKLRTEMTYKEAQECIKQSTREFVKQQSQGLNEAQWHSYFVYYPEAWRYMQLNQMLYRHIVKSEYPQITLRARMGGSTNRMEIHTFGLYCELLRDLKKGGKTLDGWTLKTNERCQKINDSSLEFTALNPISDTDKFLLISLFFHMHSKDHNGFGLSLHTIDSRGNIEPSVALLNERYAALINTYPFAPNPKNYNRLTTTSPYSRPDILNILNELFKLFGALIPPF